MQRLSMRMLFLVAIFVVALPIIAADEPTVVYLVRHAEKVAAELADDPKNPHLSAAGVERADELVRVLGEAGVTQIHSTDFFRTVETVDPLAKHLDLEISIYDPYDLETFAKELKSMPGRHVVSGHSNTTPPLVELLGGDPGPPIDEVTEYDRLYVISIGREETSTVILRYGAPSN